MFPLPRELIVADEKSITPGAYVHVASRRMLPLAEELEDELGAALGLGKLSQMEERRALSIRWLGTNLLLLAAVRALMPGRQVVLAVSRDDHWYDAYLPPYYDETVEALDLLVEQGVLEQRKPAGTRERSAIWPASPQVDSALLALYAKVQASPHDWERPEPGTVKLWSGTRKDASARRILPEELSAEERAALLKAQRNLDSINRASSRLLVTLDIPSINLAVCYVGRLTFSPSQLVYDRNYHTSLTASGRLAAPFHSLIPSELRPRLCLDGEEAVELDFSSMHPRMLYHSLGVDVDAERAAANRPPDLYHIPGFTPVGVKDCPERALAKEVLNIAINSKTRQQAAGAAKGALDSVAADYAPWPRTKRRRIAGRERLVVKVEAPFAQTPERQALYERILSWDAQDLLRRAVAEHPRLRPLLFKGGNWMALHHWDSQVAEAVLLHFARRRRPCLAVHDSFLVATGDASELERVMVTAYQTVLDTKLLPRIGRKGASALTNAA